MSECREFITETKDVFTCQTKRRKEMCQIIQGKTFAHTSADHLLDAPV